MTGTPNSVERELIEEVEEAARALTRGGLEHDDARTLDAVLALLPALAAGPPVISVLSYELVRAKRALEAAEVAPQTFALRFISKALRVVVNVRLRAAGERSRALRRSLEERVDSQVLDVLRCAATPVQVATIATATGLDRYDLMPALWRLQARRLAEETPPADASQNAAWRHAERPHDLSSDMTGPDRGHASERPDVGARTQPAPLDRIPTDLRFDADVSCEDGEVSLHFERFHLTGSGATFDAALDDLVRLARRYCRDYRGSVRFFFNPPDTDLPWVMRFLETPARSQRDLFRAND